MDLTEKKYKVKTAKTHKGRLFIKRKLPKLIEDPKKAIFLNTVNSSEIMRLALQELFETRKCFSQKLNKKNNVGCVFENTQSVEYFAKKEDASLFTYTSDSKKRPMNLVIGSLFDYKVLDAFEFEVSNFIPKSYFDTVISYEPNCQPAFVFQGELFETDKVLERFKKHILDFYAQDLLEEVNLTDLKRVIVVSVDADKTIKIRNYETKALTQYNLKDINLKEVGPSFDLVPRRNQLSSEEEYSKACKQPKLISSEHSKNKINTMLDIQGKLYTSKQNLAVASLKRYDRILSRKRKINEDVMDQLNEENDGNNNHDIETEDTNKKADNVRDIRNPKIKRNGANNKNDNSKNNNNKRNNSKNKKSSKKTEF